MSSSESEDEDLKKFAASVDTTVFSDKLYKSTTEKDEPAPVVELKSQRFLEAEENVFQSEINVSNTMQLFIGNKLSKLIEDQVEFVETKVDTAADEDQVVDNVRLLSGVEEVVKYLSEPSFIENRQKPKIKRRNVDQEPETFDSKKVHQAAVSVNAIKEEAKHWSKKPKHQPFEYKNIKGVAYIREPSNEFTKARNKNNWSEAKIKNAKFHNPPLCETIKR